MSGKDSVGMSKGLKLLIGAGGIYVSFLSYGKLHEQIFKYRSDDGEKFTFAFFLQALVRQLQPTVIGGYPGEISNVTSHFYFFPIIYDI